MNGRDRAGESAAQLAAHLARAQQQGWRLRQGEIVDQATDGTVSVSVGGSATVLTGVRAATGISIAVGMSCWLAASGRDMFVIATLRAAIADTGWLTVEGTNANSFTLGSVTPQYRKIGDVVYLRGEFFRSTSPGSSAMVAARVGALPAGCRPSSIVFQTLFWPWQFNVQLDSGGGIYIGANQGRTATPGFSIEGVSFVAGN